MAIYEVSSKRPDLADGVYVHEQASVIGEVYLGEHCSVWPQAVVCGDSESVKIGRCSNIQIGAVIQAGSRSPVDISEYVTVGSQASVHGCSIGQGSFIGERAVITEGAQIGAHSLVAAGTLIKEGARFPDNSLIEGIPAKVARTLSSAEIEHLSEIIQQYMEKTERYRSTEKLISRGRELPLYYSII